MSHDTDTTARSHEPPMKLILISARQYEADFRKFLIEALRAEGHEVWHVRVGRCSTLTSLQGREEFCGIVGLIVLVRRLRRIAGNGKAVYVDSTGAVMPFRSMMFRLFLHGTWCFDIFDNLLYDYRGLRRMKMRTSIWLLDRCSDLSIVLAHETLRLFPKARHLDNAADIPRIDRADRSFCDLIVLSAIDQRLDFDFVGEVARLAPERKIVIHGYVLHNDKAIEDRFSELCARRANVVFRGRFNFDDIPALLAPFAIGFTPYLPGKMTEFVNPDKYYMFLQAGLEVISTDIPQARRMEAAVHIAREPADVIEIARRVERDQNSRKNLSAGPDYSWRRRAREFIEFIDAVETGPGTSPDGARSVTGSRSDQPGGAARTGRSPH